MDRQIQKLARKVAILEEKVKALERKVIPVERLSEEEEKELTQLLKEPPEKWVTLEELKKKLGL